MDVRQFVLSNDPRERELNSVALLTSGSRHDVVSVADHSGESSRFIPYQTQTPTPVIGAQGLMPAAWHWTWERHGGPRLNQRFNKLIAAHRVDTEFAGWAAARSVIAAVVRTRTTAFAEVSSYLASAETTIAIYKGYPGNYRSWNPQLRQPVLLHTDNAVIALAPMEGYLHQHNELDTLGFDAQEVHCQLMP